MIRRTGSTRILYADNRPLGRIRLHDGTKILRTFQQGWLEHYKDTSLSGSDVIFINTDYRLARKIDLSKKDNFVIKYKDSEKSYYEEGYSLYIYVSDYTITDSTSETISDGATTIKKDFAEFSLPCTVQTYSFTEGNKPVLTATPMSKLKVLHCYKHEKTDYGKELEHLRNEIETIANTCISEYALNKLLKHYTITKKD